ncbi:MAG: rod shape-determining protein MreD [Muribaculaceae bacterium]|nr:rod shape-determining protein MreD [Muribaculaceae bacterium]
MTKLILKYLFMFVILLLAQAVVFNHVCLFNVALPFVFIYFIISLPASLNPNWTMTLAFLIGSAVDIFSDTLGMNALACTIAGMLRRPILRVFIPREEDLPATEPSMHSLGLTVYVRYITTFTLLYCLLIFAIESFTFFHLGRMLMRVICSTILTGVLILGIDSLTINRREKRL